MIRGFEEVAREFLSSPKATQLPTRGTRCSGGYDFYLKEDVIIAPYEVVAIPTDVKAKMMFDEVLVLHVRSSIGIKKHLMLANGTGIIDADFYDNEEDGGNITLALYNYGYERVTLKAGERVMQGIFQKYLTATNDNVIKEERTGGIGSTNGK